MHGWIFQLLILERRHAEGGCDFRAAIHHAMVASGGVIDTVSSSSLPKSLMPKALAAAICKVMACTDTFTAGTAILSPLLKSASVLSAGLRLLSKNGCED